MASKLVNVRRGGLGIPVPTQHFASQRARQECNQHLNSRQNSLSSARLRSATLLHLRSILFRLAVDLRRVMALWLLVPSPGVQDSDPICRPASARQYLPFILSIRLGPGHLDVFRR